MNQNFKDLAYKSDMGHKAKVTRESLPQDKTKGVNDALAMIGKRLEPPGIEYVGSAAVHVYVRKGIIGDELSFVCQTPLTNNCRSVVADDAALELSKQLKFNYTGKMETKRSGF